MKTNKRKFWFQTADGRRLVAFECCVVDGQPAEILEDKTVTQFNNGYPVVVTKYKCGHCGDELILDNQP